LIVLRKHCGDKHMAMLRNVLESPQHVKVIIYS
jgi:hypothetical protein